MDVKLYRTADPTVWFADSTSDPKRKYRIGGVGSASPFCTCPARVECKHLTALLHTLQEEPMSETAMVPHSTTTSIDARRAQNTSAQAISLAARGAVDGYREYLFLAQSMWEGKMVPDSVKTPQAAAVLMLRAAELGVPPMAAFELFYVVGNKVAIQSQMIAALIERSGKGWIEIRESTTERAVVVGHRDGRPPMEVEWTLEDAKNAKSNLAVGGAKDKLVWKAIARVGRRQFADVLGGMDVADGNGVVVDYGVVAEAEGEYQRPELPAPSQEEPARPAYPWLDDYKAAMRAPDRQCSPRQIAAFFGEDDMDVTSPDFLHAIQAWLRASEGPLSGLLDAVAAWLDKNAAAAATEATEAVQSPALMDVPA